MAAPSMPSCSEAFIGPLSRRAPGLSNSIGGCWRQGSRLVLSAQFDRRALPWPLFHLNAKHFRHETLARSQRFQQPSGYVPRQELGRCIFDGEQNAIAAREDPFALLVTSPHARTDFLDMDHAVPGGKQHVVIEFVGDFLGPCL